MAILTHLEALNDLIRNAVEQGAHTVEQIHQTIAAMPLEELERRGLLTDLAGTVKKDQQATLGSIYNAIRRINQEVSDLAAGLLASMEQPTNK